MVHGCQYFSGTCSLRLHDGSVCLSNIEDCNTKLLLLLLLKVQILSLNPFLKLPQSTLLTHGKTHFHIRSKCQINYSADIIQIIAVMLQRKLIYNVGINLYFHFQREQNWWHLLMTKNNQHLNRVMEMCTAYCVKLSHVIAYTEKLYFMKCNYVCKFYIFYIRTIPV
jgi:hypothetical protein